MDEPETTRGAPMRAKAQAGLKKKSRTKKPSRDKGEGRTARDATGINPKDTEPVDPKMPDMPPA